MSLFDPRSAAEDARDAGLRYLGDAQPGIRRTRRGAGFVYTSPDGRRVTDEATLRRIRALAVPPAWTDVWISPLERGHLQATGRDARGRKQYRYHARWRALRDENKYSRLPEFARALPRIRRRVSRDLGRRGLPREKVVAACVRLLETTLVRVGNDEYARDNGSYGLTTLRRRHTRVSSGEVQLIFRGKHGKESSVGVRDRRLARVVRQMQDLPGQEIFQYVDDGGERRRVTSGDVNDYLRQLTGADFTAKDFRTWAGTVLAARALRRLAPAGGETEARKHVVSAIETVAAELGNTPAVCRRCYVHPAIVEGYLDGSMEQALRRAAARAAGPRAWLHADEADVLAVLEQRLRREHRRAA